MYRRIFPFFLLSLFTVLIAVACSNQENGHDAQNIDTDTTQAEETEEAEQGTSNQDVESESDGGQEVNESENNDTVQTIREKSNQSNEKESKNDKSLPDPIEINDRVQTDTGLIFELEKIVFEDAYIEVHFNADNQSGFKKTLASKGRAQNKNLGGITLQDDTGFDYRYVADREDARIELYDQEKVDGIVRFTGRIQNDAKTLTLKFNPNVRNDASSTPKFTYENIEIKW